MSQPVTVRLAYVPRACAVPVHEGMEAHRWGAVVAHRRFGKTVLAINHLQLACLECRRERPRFGFIAPFREQAKAIAWDYLVHYSRAVPGIEVRVSELSVTYPNGGQVRLFGADNPDALRGLYFDGVVLDEYGLMPAQVFTEVLRPALSDRQGWALFLGTPAGKNQFYRLIYGDGRGWVGAAKDPGWYFGRFPASETGILPPEELAAARRDMSADEYAQEYECSFEASIKGSIYGAELRKARAEGRIGVVPIDPVLPVDTSWDLGIGDATAIWFSQSVRGGSVRLVDYYECSGEGLPHYAQVLRTKGYVYGRHIAPHDVLVRELGSGRSRLEAAQGLGITFEVAPSLGLEDGIHAVRMVFPRCWFDEAKCQSGLEALMNYRRDFNTRLGEFKATPVHDFSEHGSSAFRYLAVSHKEPVTRKPSDQRRYRQESEYGWLA